MTRWLDTVWRDVRHAARALAHSPASRRAVLSLALGIGATTTIYSVIHAVVLDPFPYKVSPPGERQGFGAARGGADRSTYTSTSTWRSPNARTTFDGLIASTISDVR